jgi:hypothetical protein
VGVRSACSDTDPHIGDVSGHREVLAEALYRTGKGRAPGVTPSCQRRKVNVTVSVRPSIYVSRYGQQTLFGRSF